MMVHLLSTFVVVGGIMVATVNGHALSNDPVQSDATAEITSRTIELPAVWRFKQGDDAAWSDPTLDDADWQTIRVGGYWEKQGLADYDGYAWYRLHVRLPDRLRRHPAFERFGRLLLSLGKIDDVDRTWFNGRVVGSTGQFPDADENA